MRPEDLPKLRTPSTPSLSPDGAWAVVSVTRPDFDADEYVGQLWRVPVAGEGAPRRITRGHRDTQPVVSPDGSVVAFLRATPGDAPQLAILPAEGGEPMVMSDAKLGVESFSFSPDSRQLVYVSRVPDEGRYGTLDGVSPGQEDPRIFTGNRLQRNGLGWFRDRPAQLFVVEVPDPFAEPVVRPVGRAAAAGEDEDERSSLVLEARRLTTDHHDWVSPVFSSDGSAVIAVAARHETSEDDLAGDLWRLPLDADDSGSDAEPERLTGVGDFALAVQDPKVVGTSVFFLASDLGESRRDFVGNHPSVWVVDEHGREEPRRLTDRALTVVPPLAAHDGGVLFADVHRGTGRLHHVGIDATTTQLTDGALLAHAPATAAGTIVCLASHARSMGDVAVLEAGQLRPLTDFSAELAATTPIVEPEEVTALAPDGYEVHGWVLEPDGEGPHPVLLNIHGGPYAAYSKDFFDEAQVYVEAGYAVVMCNPRGSWGYGSEHGRAIKGDMGNLDMVDILAFLDHALATRPSLAADRVGIMGGSYGGYMTAWIIAHDHRWAGAIVERGFLDSWSFVGSSDIGWFFPLEYTSYDRAEADRQSPMSKVDQVRTPTMVLHSEQDLRCPLHQALQYYTLLRQNGVPSELVVFPGENHELSRSGRPWHRRQRFEKILDWWARHLPVAGQ